MQEENVETGIIFAYDAAGQRTKTTRPTGGTIYYPFPCYEEEVNGSTTTRRTTYSLAGQAVAVRLQVVGGSNTVYYLHSDHLGSTTALSNSGVGGGLVSGSTARYYPFGAWRTTPTQTLTDRGFTGHLENMEIGLVYMNARYYVPYINRFLSPDTIVPDPNNPQSFNRYSYVNNRPLNRTDPTGFWDCAADAEYNRCMQWVTEILANLENDGGDLAHGLYLWFMEYDQEWTKKNGVGVLFQISEDGFGAAIPFCGGATGMCDLISDPTIQIQRDELAGLPDFRATALIGHEIAHLFQGDILAASILGEVGTYYTQGTLLKEFGEIPTGRAAYFLQQVNSAAGTYTTAEVADARTELRNHGYPWYLPSYPPNAPSPTCGYGACSPPDFFSLITEPVRFFTARSQPPAPTQLPGPYR